MINNKYIQENGKLICEFMELRTIDKRAKKNPQFHIPFSTIVYADYYLGCCSLETELEVHARDTLFHESWEWLMEVVEKIESLGIYFGISSKNITIFPIDNQNANTPVVKIMGWQEKLTKKEAIYKAVIEFIHWYNKNNHDKNI